MDLWFCLAQTESGIREKQKPSHKTCSWPLCTQQILLIWQIDLLKQRPIPAVATHDAHMKDLQKSAISTYGRHTRLRITDAMSGSTTIHVTCWGIKTRGIHFKGYFKAVQNAKGTNASYHLNKTDEEKRKKKHRKRGKQQRLWRGEATP